MAAVNASTKRIIRKFPRHAPACAVVDDSQTKHPHTHFEPSSPDSPAFISQPGGRIDDVGALLDFVPRGVSLLVLHVGTKDIARTSAETALQKYRTLLHHIKAERPDIGTFFVSLVLPRGPNKRLRHPNLRRVGIINQEAHTFNCRLVIVCNEMDRRFYLDNAMQQLLPSDGVGGKMGCTRHHGSITTFVELVTTCCCEPGGTPNRRLERPRPPPCHRPTTADEPGRSPA
ncbi:hypothetical protein HPB48_013450 [Haemaphysalis longicornis]|uniref:Uncharacterized protein n=1 Tax=Haemaphysalis longicornis TaxID=44386 RepID=A0A9J6GVH3_HAELO|nr:hypothetical protein HPB48_013450 [Haemaphysalis longicornis]